MRIRTLRSYNSHKCGKFGFGRALFLNIDSLLVTRPPCRRFKDTDILAFSEATFKSTVSDNEAAPCKVIRIPESGKFLIVESGILGLGIRNLVQDNLTPRAFPLRKWEGRENPWKRG